MDFSENVRATRKAKGLKQAELAELAGISINSVRLYEAGKRSPTLAVAEKIAAALGVSVFDLLSGPETLRACLDELQPQYEAAIHMSRQEGELLEAFARLNIKGQLVAVQRVEELGKIPDYQREEDPAGPAQGEKV